MIFCVYRLALLIALIAALAGTCIALNAIWPSAAPVAPNGDDCRYDYAGSC